MSGVTQSAVEGNSGHPTDHALDLAIFKNYKYESILFTKYMQLAKTRQSTAENVNGSFVSGIYEPNLFHFKNFVQSYNPIFLTLGGHNFLQNFDWNLHWINCWALLVPEATEV